MKDGLFSGLAALSLLLLNKVTHRRFHFVHPHIKSATSLQQNLPRYIAGVRCGQRSRYPCGGFAPHFRTLLAGSDAIQSVHLAEAQHLWSSEIEYRCKSARLPSSRADFLLRRFLSLWYPVG